MKFFACLALICLIGVAMFFVTSKTTKVSGKQRLSKTNWRAITITTVVVAVLLTALGIIMYRVDHAPDAWCTTSHIAVTQLPAKLKTAMDYFQQGDYDYETGNCPKAVTDYTASIKLNTKFPQAYNNRAYTYMRLRNYQNALPDLNKAIALYPNYVEALMNRGDINNYYLNNKASAIADYQRVIELGGDKGTSVCGHMYMAKHNGWNLGTIFSLPLLAFKGCK
jgi:tetratricopeptide (TPR) repeat protein